MPACTMRSRKARSSSRERAGSPSGWVMAVPRTIRLAPTVVATLTMAVNKTVGRPSRSSSLASVAPQRVPVPQVAGRSIGGTKALLT